MISLIIIAAVLLVTLFVLLFIARKENTRLLMELKEQKETIKTTKDETLLLGLILSKLIVKVKTNISPLNLTKLPFKLVNKNESLVLTSIRFKEIEGQALVYINGAMAPYTNGIKLNQENTLTNWDLNNLNELYLTLNHKKMTGLSITEKLEEINQNLNK